MSTEMNGLRHIEREGGALDEASDDSAEDRQDGAPGEDEDKFA